MIFFTLFLFGLLVGSFLNVVVLRLERGESFVAGRSRCLTCEHTLAWYDNIPLCSFLWLKGKCRYCRVTLSWQYPLVELMTACLFAGAGFLVPATLGIVSLAFLAFLLITLSIVVVITVYDIRFLAIPTVLLWVLNGSLFLALFVEKFFFPGASFFPMLASSVWGAAVVGGYNVPIIIDKKGIRKLTPLECFRIQGFPKNYILPKISDSAY
jgi:prepilin signal peptidase PulO-like enzyme (type II secretory pathway)